MNSDKNQIYTNKNQNLKIKSNKFSGDDWRYSYLNNISENLHDFNRSKLKIFEVSNNGAEDEQGSQINCSKNSPKHWSSIINLELNHGKSILKLKKTVSFNLHRNQTKIISNNEFNQS